MDIDKLVSFDPAKPTSKDLTVERIAAQYKMEAPVMSREDAEERLEGVSAMMRHVSSLLSGVIKKMEADGVPRRDS